MKGEEGKREDMTTWNMKSDTRAWRGRGLTWVETSGGDDCIPLPPSLTAASARLRRRGMGRYGDTTLG